MKRIFGPMRRIVGHGRYANVTATVALIIALSGTSYAAVTINGANIKNRTIAGKKLKKKTVSRTEIKNNTLRGHQINESTLGTVPSATDATNAITATKATSATTATTAANATNAVNATNAANAGTVGGVTAGCLRTSSAFNENAAVVNLPGTFVNVAAASITTTCAGRVLATASAELFGANGDETGQCRILIDGAGSLLYESEPDDIGVDNQDNISVNFGRALPAGTYNVAMQCRTTAGTVGKDDAALSVYGLGA